MAMVMDTQPRWLSPLMPLGGDEARGFSRLVESLTLKTTAMHDAGGGKAESLAKPFSKHAMYVLKVYVEVMSDELVEMEREVRKGMEEGVWALCGMISVYCRDALMVGGALDEGAKEVLKMVWREWERVRYVGKG